MSPVDDCYVVRSLTRELGSGDRRVLATAGVDLDIPAGQVFGLLGPNGAGKTTLVRQLMGVLRPDSGQVTLLGHDVVADPAWAPQVAAYLAQDEPALAELDVRTAVRTTGRLRGLSRAAAASACDDVIGELGLGGLAHRPLSALSGGERRLACVASTLVADRPVLVLDEPTTGMDPEARRAVWAALRRRREERATTVVLVTHNVLEAESVLDRVAVLDRGRVIACDTPGRLKAAVSDELRLDLVWRRPPDLADSTVRGLRAGAALDGLRWSARLPAGQARQALVDLTASPSFADLDDFTLATPSLEDVYLALGGTARDLEHS